MQSARLLKPRGRGAIWQRREDDFNLWSEKNRVEKLRHIPRRPVKTTQGDEVQLSCLLVSSQSRRHGPMLLGGSNSCL